MQIPKLAGLVCGLVLLATTNVQAAPVIDSGRIQRDIENLNNPKLPPKPPPKSEKPEIDVPKGGAEVKVMAFKITGATRFSEPELQAQLVGFLGKKLDLSGLNQAAQALSRYYQGQGWLAKVYLPPQTVENGIVTLAVTEAKLGQIKVSDSKGTRLNAGFVKHMLANNQKPGAALSSDALERTLLLINDSPGIGAQATLSPGTQGGETDVTLSLADKTLFNARLWGDNYGTQPVGKKRLNGSVAINNPSGYGDQLNLYGVFSSGLRFGQGSYEFPLGYAGSRVILGGALTDYELRKANINSLPATGNSYSYRVGLRHPIIRSRETNLNGQLTLQAMNSKDELAGLEVSDKAYHSLALALNADHTDNIGLGGTFWGGISFTTGNLSLLNRGDLATDKISARQDGDYNKLNFYLGRNQQLSEKWSAKALFSAQWADTNLGGFEKFTLGGPFGLSGYAVGEAAADEGWMLNLEGRYAISQQLSASLLADSGGVCLHKKTWHGWNAGNPELDNCYPLASVGVAMTYQHRYFDVKVGYSRQIVRNPGLDNSGRDIEGETSKNQIWLQFGAGI